MSKKAYVFSKKKKLSVLKLEITSYRLNDKYSD